jgi:ATP-dependent Lon protease
MYSHQKNNGLRHYLKSKAWSADATLACPLLGEPDHLADLVAVFDIEKMQDMLKIHDRKSNLHRNHQRFLTYLEGLRVGRMVSRAVSLKRWLAVRQRIH